MLRALIAPSDSAVWPTSTTMRNFVGSQVGATGFAVEGFEAGGVKAACFRSSSFATSRFGAAAGFGAATGLGLAARFASAAGLGDWPCFDEPLNISDSQPAWLTSI